jgi:hypothetical protein
MRKILALLALIASPALAQQPNGTINAPIYATGYISQVGGTDVTTTIKAQPNHPANLNIYTTSAISGTWTINLPNPPFEGQVLSFSCSAAAAAIVVNSSDGSSIDSAVPTNCVGNSGFTIQFDQRFNTWRNIGSGTTTSAGIIVTNNTQLTALPSGVSVATRLGYETAGDAPPVLYTRSNSACSLNAGAGDGGGQVSTSDGKCWIATFPATGADGRAWGVLPGTDVTARLQAAINWSCANHTPITLPNLAATAGTYNLSATVKIGNGTRTTYSTECKEAGLIVTGEAYEYFLGFNFPFAWIGSVGGTVFEVDGPIQSVVLEGVGISCNGACATGFKIITALNGSFRKLGVWGNTGPAFILTTWDGQDPAFGSGLEGSHFSDILAAGPSTGGSGMLVGSTTCNGAGTSACNSSVIANQFDNITLNWDANTAGTYGIRFGFANLNTFTNLRIGAFPGTSGSGIAFDVSAPAGNLAFPTDNTLIHPLIVGTASAGGSWSGALSGFHIIGWSTAIGGPFPQGTISSLYTGTDDKGNYFNSGSITQNLVSGTLATAATPSTYNHRFMAAGTDYFGIGIGAGGAVYLQSWSGQTMNINGQGNPVSFGPGLVTFNGHVSVEGVTSTGAIGTGKFVFGTSKTNWTPTDASGAGLSLTVSDAYYSVSGQTCTVTFNITYPTTADASAAKIGGVPCATNGTANSVAGGAPSFTTVTTPFTFLLSSSATPQILLYSYGGAALANSALSGEVIRASITYTLN